MNKETAKKLGLPVLPDKIDDLVPLVEFCKAIGIYVPGISIIDANTLLRREKERREGIERIIQLLIHQTENVQPYECDCGCDGCAIVNDNVNYLLSLFPHITGGWEEIRKRYEE